MSEICLIAFPLQTPSCLQINLIAPPLYVMTTQTLERSDGLEKMKEALDKIKLTIEAADGVFNIKMAVSQLWVFSLCCRYLYSILKNIEIQLQKNRKL